MPEDLISVVTLRCFGGENPAAPESIWFSDKSHFHLDGYVDQLNICAWASEHLCNIMQTPLRPEKCTVSCAVKKWYFWTYILRRHCDY